MSGRFLHVPEHVGVVSITFGPRKIGSWRVMRFQRDAKREIRRPAVGVALVQSFDIGVQLVSVKPQPFVHRDPLRCIDAAAMLPGGLQLAEEMFPVRLVGVQFNTLVAEPVFAKAPVDNIERGRLFGDE